MVELAWLNGLGGYGGKSNWCEDKEAPRPELFDVMPECMKGKSIHGQVEQWLEVE